MSTIAVNAITDASGGNTASINGATPTTDTTMGRNRIINGDMRIDQRNAGASVTINSTSNTYTLDRWNASGQLTDGVFTVDQVTDAPAGFTNSTKITVTTADASIGSTQSYLFSQFIEGNNVADLGFGTASAKTITLSFWVRSSLTGTFGGALNNSANDRNYPFTYSISAADTWEYKTITIAGDTTGTWLTDTDRGIGLRFQIGAGSSYVATAGSWTGTSPIFGATGATNLISTLNATWYITGVQLEAGSVATSFERVDYGEMLRRCQRYYQKLTYAGSGIITVGISWSTTNASARIDFLQEMRSAPTVTLPSAGQSAGTISFLNQSSYPTATGSNSAAAIDTQGFQLNGSGYTGLPGNGYASWLYPNSTAVSFAVNAEL